MTSLARKYDLELVSSEVAALLKSPALTKACREEAEKVKRAAQIMSSPENKFEIDVREGKHRVRVSVGPADKRTLNSVLKNNTLFKALWST